MSEIDVRIVAFNDSPRFGTPHHATVLTEWQWPSCRAYPIGEAADMTNIGTFSFVLVCAGVVICAIPSRSSQTVPSAVYAVVPFSESSAWLGLMWQMPDHLGSDSSWTVIGVNGVFWLWLKRSKLAGLAPETRSAAPSK